MQTSTVVAICSVPAAVGFTLAARGRIEGLAVPMFTATIAMVGGLLSRAVNPPDNRASESRIAFVASVMHNCGLIATAVSVVATPLSSAAYYLAVT